MKKELPPLTDEFIKNGIASGWITPPSGGPGPSQRRQVLELVSYTVAIIGLIVLGFLYGMSTR